MNDLLRRMLFLPEQASDYARQVDPACLHPLQY